MASYKRIGFLRPQEVTFSLLISEEQFSFHFHLGVFRDLGLFLNNTDVEDNLALLSSL